jgi:hypothetical protein
MNLIEAIKSGKRFRRKSQPGSDIWFRPSDTHPFYQYEITADDWEVESQKATITREQFDAVWSKYVQRLDPADRQAMLEELDTVAKELGL